MAYKIGFAGTDGRTLLSALVTSTATSENYQDDFQGVVIRGMPAMPPFAMKMQWPVEFIPTADNSKKAYADAIIDALKNGSIDCVVPMPEDLLLDGLVDELEENGLIDRIIGFTRKSSFIEGDKIACKRFCHEYNIPVADKWYEVDAGNYEEVLSTCLVLLDLYGGACWTDDEVPSISGVAWIGPFSLGGNIPRIMSPHRKINRRSPVFIG